MSIRIVTLAFVIAIISMAADGRTADMSGYRELPGLVAVSQDGAVTVTWDGERGQEARARFAIEQATPTVRELAVRKKGDPWTILGSDLVPEFGVTTGIRRTGHGLDHEHRWDVFWDAPLNHPDEVRRFTSAFRSDRLVVKTEGARLEVSFPGLTMGSFAGGLRFTVYRGTNLLRVEAIATTNEPSVAYIYRGALKGFSAEKLSQVVWRDGRDRRHNDDASAGDTASLNVLRARNRLAVAGGKGGSIAVFPPPHQFFFAREIEVNLGYVWHRRDDAKSFSLGIRQGENAEGYNPVWAEKVFSLYNAPPGTQQRMPVYFYLNPDGTAACREAVLAFTHADRYKPLPGYRTMVTHFHTAFTQELLDSGSLDTTPPWIPMMRSLGINIAHIFDFHGDGHPHDKGPLRLKELQAYFEGCRRHSDADFLILPGEEANAYLGGHYNVLFPRPVYWTMVRAEDQPLVENDPTYGTVYHCGSAADVFELMKRADALVWTTHPRTKGSTGYPDAVKDRDYFRSDRWLGTAFKALPVDLSQKRLGEVRCFGTLDDMNNWGGPKFMVGEVDTYKKFPEYDLYGDFNVNYVKLDRVPAFDDWGSVSRALRAGEFFVTTGEILIPNWRVEGTGKDSTVVAEVEWTYPLEFVEAVWGDGERVGRMVVNATDQPPFSAHQFRIPFDASGKKWVRFAAWDTAGNGAFTQPVRLAGKTNVTIRGDSFLINGTPTYAGRRWHDRSVEGLLLNARMVQGIFDDLNPETRSMWHYPDTGKWDPDRNTHEFLAAMPEWRKHGLLAFTINLQGGSPQGYTKGRQPWHNSAITPSGELRPDYMDRLGRILDRADELGMVVILGLFYFGQDERLEGEAAVLRAVDRAVDWVFERDYRHVLIEVNNECNVQYDHAVLRPDRVHELIERVKARQRAGRRLLVGTSYGGGTIPGERVVRASDFLLLHGNGVRQPERIRQMVRQTRAVPGYRAKPILFNEDDHFEFDRPDNNLDAALAERASWGYFDPGANDYRDGYQSPPVNWGLNTARKRAFFARVREIAGD